MAISTWQSLNPSGCQRLGSSAPAETRRLRRHDRASAAGHGNSSGHGHGLRGAKVAAEHHPNGSSDGWKMAGRWVKMEENLKMDEVFGVICSMNFSDKHLR